MKYLYYMTYLAGHSGLSNIIMSTEVGIVLAFLTDRVLILDGDISPTANLVNYKGLITNQHRSRVSDLFDFPVPWIPAADIDVSVYDAHELTDTRLMDCVYYYPRDLDISTTDSQQFAHQRTRFLTDDETCQAATVLKLSGGPEDSHRQHNLTFYSSFFYLDAPTRQAVYRMLRAMRPKPYITEFVERVTQDLGTFNAVHIRRGDFKVTYGTTTLVRTPQDVLDALAPHFDPQDKLVVVTDETDDPFFQDITAVYRDHVFIDHFILEHYRDEFLDLPHHDGMMLAFLSQLVAAESQDFIGTMTSTFTSLIQRYRGNTGKPEPFKFLWNELPDPAERVERGRHAVSTCVPMQHGIMVEEGTGPYSWNRYNPRINPAWQREWPEGFLYPVLQDDGATPRGTKPLPLVRQLDEAMPLVNPGERDIPPMGPLYVTCAAHQVAIASDHAEILADVQRHFATRHEPGPQPLVGQLQVDTENGHYRLLTNGDIQAQTTSCREMIPYLRLAMAHHLVRVRPDLVWLYGSAMAHAGSSVVVSGPWEEGQRRLVKHLQTSGWSCLANGVLAVDAKSGIVLPFPEQPADGTPPESTEHRAVRLVLLIVLHASPQAQDRIEPHAPATAVAELLQRCVAAPSEATIAALCSLVERFPTVRLLCHDIQRAAELVRAAHRPPP